MTETTPRAGARHAEMEPGETIDLFEGFAPDAERYGDQALLHPEEIAHLLWRAGLAHVERCIVSGSVPHRGPGRPRRDERRNVHPSDLTLSEREELGTGSQRYVTINRHAPRLLAFLTGLGFGPCCSMLIEVERLGTSTAISEKEITRLVPRQFRKRRCCISFDVAVPT